MKIKKPDFLIAIEKKVKKISDILNNKRLKSFEILVTFQSPGSRKKKTISIQGERSADGGLSTWFPGDRISDALQSPEDLNRKLENIQEQVRKYIVENTLDADWEIVKTSIHNALETGLTVDDLENQIEMPVRARVGYGYEAHFFAPILATVYSIKAVEALAKSDLSHASYCVDQGHRWSRSDRFLPNPKARFSERARTGGKEKDARREPVKKKVAELLLKLAPEEGWSTTTAAVSAVTGELIDNDSSLVKECHLKTDNLPRVIAGWIEEDSERFPHRIKSKN